MIGFEEAIELIDHAARPVGQEKVAIGAVARRVLSKPVIARIASPRCDVSAMDGYAVRDADLDAFPARLQVVGEAFAGEGWDGEIGPGECARIFTGAPVPTGTDRVVIQENIRREGKYAVVDEHPGSARHIRKYGGDFEVGDELLAAGRPLDPRAVVAAAAADVAEIDVFIRPCVHVLSTGDELVEPGSAATTKVAVPESVSFGVAALAEQWGARLAGRSRVRDDLPSMEKAAAEAAKGADLVIVTGGASVGEKDFARTMFEPLGLQLIFSKVAIKPGKPVWLGRAGDTLVMGLPGNPTSALVTARLLLAPLLCRLGGRNAGDALRWRYKPLGSPLMACGPRETFHRGRWTGGSVKILSNQDSSAQKELAQADLLIRQRSDAPAQQVGDTVEVLDF